MSNRGQTQGSLSCDEMQKLLNRSQGEVYVTDESLTIIYKNEEAGSVAHQSSRPGFLYAFLPSNVHKQLDSASQKLLATSQSQSFSNFTPSETAIQAQDSSQKIEIRLTHLSPNRIGWHITRSSKKSLQPLQIHSSSKDDWTHGSALFLEAMQSSKIGLWRWDTLTNQAHWNEQALKITGQDVALTLPQCIELLSHPDDREKMRSLLKVTQKTMRLGPIPPSVSRLICPDGSIRWVLLTGAITPNSQGRPRYMTGAFLDVTQMHEAAESDKIADDQEKLGRFTAGIAHNFNNMLMIIEPCLEELEEVVPESHREMVHDATEAGVRSSELIRELMTVGGQKNHGPRQAVALKNICEQAMRSCRSRSPQALRLQFHPDSTSHVQCAPGAIEHVLTHLLLNARDALVQAHTPDAQVTTTLKDIEKKGQSWVEITISDNGPGMSDAIKARIFDPFFSTHVGLGSGLGLATSQAIVREHGGKIACRSIEGKGTTFSLQLPTAPEPHAPKTESNMKTSEKSAARVLVVDDEEAICRVVTRTLERNGFEAHSISDPEELASTLASRTFDIVLLDRSMGTTQGSALVPLFRQMAPEAKILFFTGEFVDAAEVAKVDGVVQKPINGKMLAETLRKVL